MKWKKMKWELFKQTYILIKPNVNAVAIDGNLILKRKREEDKYQPQTKKSTVSQLTVDNVVEITGGPFKGMKATITRIDTDKEEATVVLLDAAYQLPVTVDANYLKLSSEAQEGLNFHFELNKEWENKKYHHL